jgi:hypothetical protein
MGRVFRSSIYFRGVDGKIILKWIFKKWGGEAWTRLIWLKMGTGECREFVD